MRKIVLLAIIAIAFISCANEGTDDPSIQPEPEGISLQVFYNLYCFGYKVTDTTALRVFGLSELDGFIYLTGTRKGKLWIGRFDWQSKAQLYEFVDSEDFKTEQQFHVGYGEYRNVNIDRLQLLHFIEGDDYKIIKLWYDSRASDPIYGVGFGFLYFINNLSEKRYISYSDGSGGSPSVRKWYNNSYLDIIDVQGVTCFSQYGDSLFMAGYLPADDVYPIDYKNYIYFVIDRGYDFEKEESRMYITAKAGNFAFLNENNVFDWSCNLFIINDNNPKFSTSIVKKQDNVWTFQVDVTDYSGYTHSRKAEINIETGQLLSLL